VAATSPGPGARQRGRGRRPARLLARIVSLLGGALGGALAGTPAQAADLPEDRADLMFHSYTGGGVVANGPAVLVRKSLDSALSLSASYYVDMVSNASIDVVTTASGLQYRVISPGAGPQPKPTDEVTVNYTGKLLDGTEFDSFMRHYLTVRTGDIPREREVYDVTDAADIERVLKSYRDFVALCARKQRETGQPCLIIASY